MEPDSISPKTNISQILIKSFAVGGLILKKLGCKGELWKNKKPVQCWQPYGMLTKLRKERGSSVF